MPNCTRVKSAGSRLGSVPLKRPPERESIESRRRRNHRRQQLAPEPVIRWAQDQLCQPKERLAEKAAADAARNLIVFRREGGLAGDLPEQAARKRESHRLPVVEARRSREAGSIDRPLIRVHELVDGERIVVDHPRGVKVASDRRAADVVCVAIDTVVETVQEEVEGDDVDEGNEVI